MAKMVHSMIRVLDEKRTLAFYGEAFGLKLARRRDFPDFSLLYLSNGEANFELELTVNKGRDRPYELGEGYGHLAVTVADLDAERARFERLGFPLGRMVDMKCGDVPVARYFFVTDPDGYKIEVIERKGDFA